MTQILSPKLIRRQYGDLALHEQWRPGCNAMHQIAVDTPFWNGARWTWDGNAAAPTFSPSVNITLRFALNSGRAAQICHYFTARAVSSSAAPVRTLSPARRWTCRTSRRTNWIEGVTAG
ncbi:hypothetical protein FHW79_001681 [Azospirillum sp. OGB3]|uniref:DUF6527 family protein n=1 Tax=Azospirillum sp. OGB3 TaxID=2587012 RepID=UPI001606CAE0|nr:DUF6527 family protein [Azospirillum sp. OGB3]MBB3264066.1 hypothetical protein [Azospirillum sp. OGB3]